MQRGTSGLAYDLDLVRRRAWLFVPFLVFGLLVSFALGSVSGQATAVSSMQLETVVQDLVVGGDRGLRIFEAQAMTHDPAFKAKVIEAVGEPDFDYARFTVALSPVSVADGVSRGRLTVSVADADGVKAQQYRDAFVTVFTAEYSNLDGLFRQRFVLKKQEVADVAEKQYADGAKALADKLGPNGPPVDELVRSPQQANGFTLVQELNRQEAELTSRLGQVDGALVLPSISGATAGAILGITVSDGDARNVLQQSKATLTAGIERVRAQRKSLSDTGMSADLRAEVDNLRALAEVREESYIRLNNAKVAVTSAQSTLEVSNTLSGGMAGTPVGRVAVVITVTIVFGLIAIYALEWLLQVRRGYRDRIEDGA